jgi:tetratricopeptide (TPR) repeat protein
MMISIFLFLGTFALYLLSLSGTIPSYRDSGDMINAVSTLGIAHPPGYPFYVVVGKLFSEWMPMANAAYRVNVFSAVCAAGAVVLLYRIARSQGVGWLAAATAFAAAILFAGTPAVLSLARVSEMYAPAALVGAGILACYIHGTSRSLLLGSFLLGIGFGVHPTLLFLAPLLVPFKPSSPAASSRGSIMMDSPLTTAGNDVIKQIFYRGLFFLLGFSVIFILYFRAGTDPVQNWGNPNTLLDLWKLITRSNYGGLKLHPTESQFSWTLDSLFNQLFYFGQTFFRQWGWIGSLGGLLGAYLTFRRYPALSFSWVFLGPAFFLLSNLPLQAATTGPILQPYLVLVNLLWAFWVAAGLYGLFSRSGSPILQGLLLVGVLAVSLARPAEAFYSQRRHFYAYDLGRNMMRTFQPRAVIYDPDDPIAFTLRGLQLNENRRTDVVLLNFHRTYWGYKQIAKKWPDLLPLGTFRSAQQLEYAFWSYSMKVRPFYADLPVKIPSPLAYRMEGILYPITSQAVPLTSNELAQARRYFELYIWRGVWRTTEHADFFTNQILNYHAAAWCNLGLKYAETRDWETARYCYRRALSIDPKLSAAFNNLGVADFEQRNFKQAILNYRFALLFDPNNQGYRRNLELAETSQ